MPFPGSREVANSRWGLWSSSMQPYCLRTHVTSWKHKTKMSSLWDPGRVSFAAISTVVLDFGGSNCQILHPRRTIPSWPCILATSFSKKLLLRMLMPSTEMPLNTWEENGQPQRETCENFFQHGYVCGFQAGESEASSPSDQTAPKQTMSGRWSIRSWPNISAFLSWWNRRMTQNQGANDDSKKNQVFKSTWRYGDEIHSCSTKCFLLFDPLCSFFLGTPVPVATNIIHANKAIKIRSCYSLFSMCRSEKVDVS